MECCGPRCTPRCAGQSRLPGIGAASLRSSAALPPGSFRPWTGITPGFTTLPAHYHSSTQTKPRLNRPPATPCFLMARAGDSSLSERVPRLEKIHRRSTRPIYVVIRPWRPVAEIIVKKKEVRNPSPSKTGCFGRLCLWQVILFFGGRCRRRGAMNQCFDLKSVRG